MRNQFEKIILLSVWSTELACVCNHRGMYATRDDRMSRKKLGESIRLFFRFQFESGKGTCGSAPVHVIEIEWLAITTSTILFSFHYVSIIDLE